MSTITSGTSARLLWGVMGSILVGAAAAALAWYWFRYTAWETGYDACVKDFWETFCPPTALCASPPEPCPPPNPIQHVLLAVFLGLVSLYAFHRADMVWPRERHSVDA